MKKKTKEVKEKETDVHPEIRRRTEKETILSSHHAMWRKSCKQSFLSL